MPRLPHPTWLRAFEASARHGSFSAAADELGLTAAAVSQQIRLLEAHLGADLFERLPRGVALTDKGQAYALPIRKGFADMETATAGLFDAPTRRRVRVRAAISCAALVIAPRLVAFHTLHPDVNVELTTAVWSDRFTDDNSDIDIRFGYGDWRDGVVTHLGHEYAVPVCRADYAATFGDTPSPAALAAGKVVSIHGSESDWPRLLEQNDQGLFNPSDETRVDSSLLALQTVAAGPGVTIVLESFADPFLRRGELIKPVPDRLAIRPSHFLVLRNGAQQRTEVRQFADWVAALYLP